MLKITRNVSPARRLIILLLTLSATASAAEVLPSWNDVASKQAIVEFVDAVSDPRSESYVPAAERIAVFDNDGTLWSEQPVYFQLVFAADRIKAMADANPDWQHTQPYKAILEDDHDTLAAAGMQGVLEILMTTHAGMTVSEFRQTVADWITSARHPRFDRPYSELVYQPMLEILEYLRANGFTTYIVSGGGVEFMRVFAEEVYGIPPHQVIGSSIETKFEMRDGAPALVRQPKLGFIDDKEGKPVAINQYIGRRPIAAFGNSDGDLQMLQWSAAGDLPNLQVIVRHTDATREWAYDRDSHIGRLDTALDEAGRHGWVVIDIRNDWKTVYPPATDR